MTNEPTPGRRIRLLDLSALVVGYGLAALLIRASIPLVAFHGAKALFVIGLAYLWLGLAMSGPIVLLFDPRAAPQAQADARLPQVRISDIAEAPRWDALGFKSRGAREPADPEVVRRGLSRYTRPELAWLSIGMYWILITLVVISARRKDNPLFLIGLFQVLTALVLWVFGPRPSLTAVNAPSWTHRAAIGLLLTWPPAWLAFILLSKM